MVRFHSPSILSVAEGLIFCIIFSLFFIPASCWAGTIKGTVTAKNLRSPKDAVIYIKDVQGVNEFPAPLEHAVIDQKALTFIPHVLPILKGTTVDFLNSDAVAHNVFSPSETADKMDLGTWQRGQARSYTFNKLGVVELLCNLHSEMSAYILVLGNPYFAKTEKDGKFQIENVPAGEYNLSCWHESIKLQSKTITVSEKEEAVVDFILERR